MHTSSISRRMEACIAAYQNGDYEAALVQYFPALDKTAKRRRPKERVGSRIKTFIDDELDIISHIATQNIFRVTCDGISFPEAIYKFGRTCIVHEGELDERLNFDNQSGLSIGKTWNLPPTFIIGLIVAVVVAPENSNEKFSQQYLLTIHGKHFDLSEMWGASASNKRLDGGNVWSTHLLLTTLTNPSSRRSLRCASFAQLMGNVSPLWVASRDSR